MSETRSVPKRRRRHGEKAEKRPKRFATAPVNEGGKAVFRQAPAFRGLPVEAGAPSPLGKSWGGGGRGAAKRASSPESQHRHAGLVRAAGRRSSSRSFRPGARERPRQPSRRPSPPTPVPDTHGSVRLRAGATWWRPERTRSPCPSPATPGPGHGGWPRSRRAAVSGPRLGRGGGPAGTGCESRERLRLRPGRHVLKSPGADWLEWGRSGVPRLTPSASRACTGRPPTPARLFTTPQAFTLGVGDRGDSEGRDPRLSFPSTFAPSSFLFGNSVYQSRMILPWY